MQVPNGRDQVSGGVSVPCRHTNPSQMFHGTHSKFSKRSSSVQSLTSRGCHCIWSGHRMSFNICERETSYCLIRSPYRPLNLLNDDFKRSLTYPCSRSLFESRVTLGIKHPYEERARAYRISCEIKTP